MMSIAKFPSHRLVLFLLGILLGQPLNLVGVLAASATPPKLGPLAESASLAAASQVCSIIKGGRVVCADPRAKHPQWSKVQGLANVTSIAAGLEFLCALSQQGGVKCWGRDPVTSLGSEDGVSVGLFGDGKQPHHAVPRSLNRVKQRVVAMAAQAYGVQLRLADGTLQSLNNSLLHDRRLPNGGRDIHSLSLVDGGACLLSKSGQVECNLCGEQGCTGWSVVRGFSGPVSLISITCGGECSEWLVGLPQGGPPQSCRLMNTPGRCPELQGISGALRQLVHACGRTETGEVYCWAESMERSGPPLKAQRIPLPESATELAANSGSLVCARLASGRIACFRWDPLFGRMDGPARVLDAPQAQ